MSKNSEYIQYLEYNTDRLSTTDIDKLKKIIKKNNKYVRDLKKKNEQPNKQVQEPITNFLLEF